MPQSTPAQTHAKRFLLTRERQSRVPLKTRWESHQDVYSLQGEEEEEYEQILPDKVAEALPQQPEPHLLEGKRSFSH